MNKRGIELAISTLIILVIAVLVLIAVIFALQGGFESFQDATGPLSETAGASAVIQACNLACESENALSFCCNDFELDGENVRCDDERLGISCDVSCAAVSCLTGDS